MIYFSLQVVGHLLKYSGQRPTVVTDIEDMEECCLLARPPGWLSQLIVPFVITSRTTCPIDWEALLLDPNPVLVP